MTIPEALQLATRHHRSGQFADAENLYRQVLRLDPRNADAIGLLGLLAFQVGKHADADRMLKAAISIDAKNPRHHYHRGLVLAALKQLDESAVEYRHAITLDSNFADAFNNLGSTLESQGKTIEAAEQFAKAAALRPDNADYHYNFGNVLLQLGRFDGAIAAYRPALQIRPNFAEALNNLGAALCGKKLWSDALTCFEQALQINPRYVDARNNRGNALLNLHRPKEAADEFRAALIERPNFPEAHNNLANALSEQGLFDQAVASFQNALKLRPDWPQALNNFAMALRECGQFDRSIETFRRSNELLPGNVDTLTGLAHVLNSVGRTAEAIACYDAAIAADPSDACTGANQLFILQFDPRTTPHSLLEASRSWNQRHFESMRQTVRPHANDPDPDRRLRIGYVSPDFREHCQSLFTLPLLANHDKNKFEIFCYASATRTDAITARLQPLANVWRPTPDMSDDALANLIHTDQIDVLVDLTMHMSGRRPRLFALKPAPVQMTYLAYPGTTGLWSMDYRLSDPFLDPPGTHDDWYSEQTIRLRDTFWCFDAYGLKKDLTLPLPQPNALPSEQNGFVTFGCLNNFCKINDGILDLWSRVLKSIPNSHVRMLAPLGDARRRVLEIFSRNEIAADRVEFVEFQPRRAFLQEFHKIDVCLDTLPYNGHTTSLDSFWMGVPVITRLGHTVVGRAGWSQLSNLGLTELAAETDDQFVQIAIELARDLPRLSELRRTLRDRITASPLMDAPRFTRNVEEAYRRTWQTWCKNHESSPVPLSDLIQLARAKHAAGDLPEAEKLYRRIIRQAPDNVTSIANLGLVLHRAGQSAEAIELFRKTIEIDPKSSQCHANLGGIMAELERHDEAIAHLRRALELQPNLAPALYNLALSLQNTGRSADASAMFDRAVQIDPGSSFIADNRLFALHLDPVSTSSGLLAEHRAWDQRFALPLEKFHRPHSNQPDPGRKLRIGYVSPDLRDHPVGRQMLSILKHRDRDQFETACYFSSKQPDAMTEMLKSGADAWRDVSSKNDSELAQQIRADQIDVLVDLALHSSGNRLLAFAFKPAPVQITFAGYPGGTGLTAMDARLTDPFLDPPGETDSHYVERSLHVLDSFWCYDPESMQWDARATPPPDVSALPAGLNGFLTFGNLGQFRKVNDGVLKLWSHVLNAVPQSRLRMLAPQGNCRTRTLQIFSDLGVSQDRIDFIDRQPRPAYLREFDRIDVCLDTLPYNGHVTSLDSTWMGVPVVTRIGQTVVGRAGWSQLSNLGLPELAARDDDQFVTIAVELANDLPRLSELRRILRDRMLNSPLTNVKKFTRGVEAGFRQAWQTWCSTR